MARATKSTDDLAPEPSTLERIRAGARGNVEVTSSSEASLTFDELLAKLDAAGDLENVTDLGSGYHLVRGKENKAKFVDVPFIIEDYRINPDWKFGEGVTLFIRTGVQVAFEGRPYDKFILNDGSTGIAQTIVDRHVAKGLKGNRMSGPAILCKRGLTMSEYDVNDPTDPEKKRKLIDPATGQPTKGVTYYLDTSN